MPRLRTLDFECIVKDNSTLRGVELEPALDHVRETLERLRIARKSDDGSQHHHLQCAHLHHQQGQSPVYRIEGHSDLRFLTSLTHLHISPRILLGEPHVSAVTLSSVLPSSLRELGLIAYMGDLDALEWHVEHIRYAVTKFIEREGWRRLTPRLEKIVLEDLEGREMEHSVQMQLLKEVCEENGLQFVGG